MKAELLRINNIALDNHPVRLNLTIYEYEILLVCGLSDSGIFDLADLLSGFTPMLEGSLWVQERPKAPQWLRNPTENWIFRFQKQPAVVKQLTVAENIFAVSGKKKRSLLVSYAEINALAEEILLEFDLHISPTTTVAELTLAETHIIELIRATYFGARLIILDDVFESYTDADRQFSYRVIKTLHEIGISFLIFSSEHEELSTLFNRITIIRDGENVKSIDAAQYDKDLVYRYMLGGPSRPLLPPPQSVKSKAHDAPVFSAEHISTPFLHDISFSAYAGETFALLDTHDYSLHRLLDALLTEAPYQGVFTLNQRPIKRNNRYDLATIGLGVLDGKDQSILFDTLSWPENLALMYRNRMGRKAALSVSKCAQFLAAEYADFLDALPTDVALKGLEITPYQRVTLHYLCWIVRKPTVLLCIRPHATTDVIMRSVVDTMLQLATSKDICVIVASSNPKEAVCCASRIACLKEGHIVDILPSSDYVF